MEKTVVEYMVDEMNDNRESSTVRSAKNADAFTCKISISCSLNRWNMLTWVNNVRPGGDWDHKPEIIARWKRRFVIAVNDQAWKVEHDVWSNFHFGYISAEAGYGNIGRIIWATENLPGVGETNRLDSYYIASGYEFGQTHPGRVDVETFNNWLGRELPIWAEIDDRSAAVRWPPPWFPGGNFG